MKLENEVLERGWANFGDASLFNRSLQRVRRQGRGTIGFIGGSITQGSLSSTPDTCYAKLVFDGLCERMEGVELNYINAGIGGTTSQFGAARVREDLLRYEPDIVFVEFSVNDEDEEFFKETYEGLVRKILFSPWEPGVILLCNGFYDSGKNAQNQHIQIARKYKLPCISFRDSLYPEIQAGHIKAEDITPDMLHPNDLGHSLLAQCALYGIDGLMEAYRPMTHNLYESAYRIQNGWDALKLEGFSQDRHRQENIRDIFANGWSASHLGDSITLELPEITGLAVQYRKTINKPAPVALAIIDGNEEGAIRLDGNFDEDWGDCLYLETLFADRFKGQHTLTIRIIEADQIQTPFYLVSVIVTE